MLLNKVAMGRCNTMMTMTLVFSGDYHDLVRIDLIEAQCQKALTVVVATPRMYGRGR